MEQFSLGHSYKFNTASFLSIIGLQRKVCLQLPSSALIWIFRLLMHFSTQMFLYSFDNSSILLQKEILHLWQERSYLAKTEKETHLYLCQTGFMCLPLEGRRFHPAVASAAGPGWGGKGTGEWGKKSSSIWHSVHPAA